MLNFSKMWENKITIMCKKNSRLKHKAIIIMLLQNNNKFNYHNLIKKINKFNKIIKMICVKKILAM